MKFEGVYTALITPFKKDGSLDEETYRTLVQRQIDAGVAGIVPCGTTGESPTLTLEEHEHVIDIAVKLAKGKCTVIAGAGSNSTAEAIRLSQHAQEAGADAVLSVNPYYNKPTQLGLYYHFKAIADAVKIPVVLYNIAGRTGVNLETPTLLQLEIECSNIIAVKEASGNINQMKDVIKSTNDEFCVLSGDDSIAVDLIKEGGQGVISVASNIIPDEMINMVSLALNGKTAEAEKINAGLASLFNAMFIETNPIPVKTAMAAMNLCDETFRLPLCELSSEENRKQLLTVLQNLDIIK
jgi:4-hydroxy-tetrahydrodipicolinate synthase